MSKIDMVLYEDLFVKGIKQYITWDSEKAPHIAVSGITGTGKTYLVKLILARISKEILDSSVTVCDFKGDKDFSFLKSCESFYRFDACKSGFDKFYDSFIQCQQDEQSNKFKVIMFDEWASYLNFLDKKEADEAKKKLASLLMLGRSFNYHVILSQQRLDAESFAKSRDNFNVVITLGNISKEVKEMLYSDYKDEILSDRTQGTGYILTNGANFQKIIVPTINQIDLVNYYIKQAVER